MAAPLVAWFCLRHRWCGVALQWSEVGMVLSEAGVVVVMRFWVAISKHGLRPIEKTGREFVEALPTAEPFEVEARLPADAAFDRHMGGVMDALAGALHTTADTVRAKLLIDTGNFTVVGKRDGNTVIAVSATSRSAITDPALRAFWDEAKVIIVNDMLPCIKDDAERHRVQELLSLEPA